MAVRFLGRLKIPVLERVVREITRRHETLRTTFIEGDGEPRQVILPWSRVVLRQADLTALPPSRREEEMRRLAGIEVLCPFDLGRGPLARVLLLRATDTDQVAVLTLHHIIADGWSMGVLIHELRELYTAFDAGLPSPLPELSIQYVDFAHWQRRRMDDQRLEPGLAYWRRQLSGPLPVLEMPTDRPRTADAGSDGRVLWFLFPRTLVRKLQALAESLGGTVFMVLLGAFSTLLSRYTGQGEVLFGSPVANRHRRELEAMIGVFVNTLVLRADLQGDPLFPILFERIREMTLGALAHQEVPFERLVEDLHPDRDLAHHPFFQVIFVLQNIPMERLELPELILEPYELERRAEPFDMTLSMMEVEEGVFGSLTYNTDLYDATTMKRLLGHFEQLLEGIAESPDRPLSEFDFLTPAERQQLLERWPTPQVGGNEGGIASLFTAQAERTPAAVAVVDGVRAISYGALLTASAHMAQLLRQEGVDGETVVGVALEPGAEAVTAILAVLRAGGAYLPLDRSHPSRRIRNQLELCEVSIVVTRGRSKELFAELGGSSVRTQVHRRILDVDALQELGETPPLTLAQGLDGSTDSGLAYVLFTSGSTGEPKGVAMPHGALVNLLRWQQHQLPLGAGDRVAQLAFLGFDVSFQEIFTTLSWGGTLVIVPPPLRRNPNRWPDFLDHHRVERFFVPFVGLERLVEAVDQRATEGGWAGPGGKVPSLRHLITAGEQLRITPRLVRLFERQPALTLHNHYGPTESHVVTSHTLTGPSESWPVLPPIGRAIDGSPVRILDPRLSLVPDGVVGELLLAGVAQARGYFARPSLTAARFLPDPWSAFPGGRLYRTGDRGRHLKGGEIEFLGRGDRQLKVRGFRIEPGEVETALTDHPAVAEAAVVGQEGAAGKVRLAAYIVARSGPTPTVGELRDFLSGRLPEYMLPTAFIFLDGLPTTATGKVDRRALPAMATNRPRHLPPPEPPRNAIEEGLAESFSRVLGVDAVGVHDHFLELGGDSILALQVVAQARRVGLAVKLEHLFSHPTVAELAELAEPVEGIDQLVGIVGADRPEGAAEGRERLFAESPELEDLYPLSPMQQGILFHHLLGRADGEYLEYFRGGIGDLDVAHFRRAWKEVIGLHPALRTYFLWHQETEPLQGVLRDLPLPFEVNDLRALQPVDQEERIRAHVSAKSLAQRFDPGRAPLHHLALFHLGNDHWEFIWSFHDLVLDGWSGPLVLNQVAERYRWLSTARDGEDPPWEAPQWEPPPPFRLYVDWLGRQSTREGEVFWRQYLAGYEPPSEVAPSTPSTPVAAKEVGDDPYGQCELVVREALSEGLRTGARRRRLTLNTLVQAAWGILLGRFQGAGDVVFGSVVSGRPADLAGSGDIVGVPVNTLPVRVQMEPGASLGPWLEELQRQQVEARRFEHLALVKIHRWSGVAREMALFESILAFVNYPPVASDFWRRQRWSPQRIGYPLFLLARPDRELYLELTFDRRRYDAATAARMLRQLQAVLEGLVAEPEGTLGCLPSLHLAERHQLLIEWNDSARALPATTVVELIDAWAAAVPERIAAAAAGPASAVLSYGALMRHAAGAAGELESRGLENGALVPILAPRGLDFLVAVLALWRAGAAYLPLDPEHPPERLRQILGRAGCPWALVAEPLQPLLQAALEDPEKVDRPQVLHLESLLAQGHRQLPRPSRATPEGLAYTIFTSGSTGVPKGAQVHHRGMLNHLRAKITDLGLRAEDRVAQTASQCFDISVWQLVVGLLVGGRVEIFERSDAVDPERLPAALTAARVTVFETVPSLLGVMLDFEEQAPPSTVPWPRGLRWLIPTGEALPPEFCRRWFFLHPQVPLVNAYGPTECSDDVTHYTLHRSPSAATARIPIGRAVENTRLYVLDRRLEPVPLGGTGGLYVGGAGVGFGYLGEGRRTARVFVPDPFSRVHSPAGGGGGRLYFTGDRARFLPDGELEFLGRLDHQVKIRGFRIELPEIEAALSRQPGISHAAVIVRPDAAGRSALAAFTVAAPGAQVDAEELRRALRVSLPDYMIPTSWHPLDALPLLTSGKVDRAALSRKVPQAVAAGAAKAPRTPLETRLAEIWSEVLGLPEVGVDDDFFALGGHSLLATQAVSRVRRDFEVELTLQTFFKSPTVAELAKTVEEHQHGAGSLPLVPVPRDQRQPQASPLSFAQERLWFLERLNPDAAAYHLASAIELSGNVVEGVVGAALDTIRRRHESLRTTFDHRGGDAVQMVAPFEPEGLPVVDLTALENEGQGREVSRLVVELARRPFDLGRGPLFRPVLLRLRPDRRILALTMHHIVSDGWSFGILFKELATAYESLAVGRRPELPPLWVQPADFAAWQRQWLRGDVLERQVDYWKERLHGAPEALELPVDRPRPARPSFHGRTLPVDLGDGLSAALNGLSKRFGVTLFMTLLGGFYALLGHLLGRRDLLVGVPISGRNRFEIEGLIGFFVNTLVLRADLSDDPPVERLLSQVSALTLGAYDHQDLPFETLVEILQPTRDLSRHPLFQISFQLHNAPDVVVELDDVRLGIAPIAGRTSKFDLSLSLVEGDEGLVGSLEYSSDLYDATTMERLLRAFRVVLRAMVDTPEEPWSTLPTLNPAASHQLLVEWNDTFHPIAPGVLEQIAERADRQPHGIAVVCGESHMSLGVLRGEARSLATRLQRRGVKNERRVAVALPRTPELVMTLLAILSAGGAYVPLDLSLPALRLRQMVEDAEAVVVVGRGVLPWWSDRSAGGAEYLDLDRLPVGEVVPSELPPPCADALAYVLYTSGSTGKPKGVQVNHRGLANLVAWHVRSRGITEHDRASSMAGLGFDATVLEIWPNLVGGAPLELVADDLRQDPEALPGWLTARRVTQAFLPTALAEAILTESWPPRGALRALLTGGDRLTRRPSADHGPTGVLVNHYGPSECTVVATVGEVESRGVGLPTIGRPIDRLKAYVLDLHLRPVPLGTPGELSLAGPQVGRGYLGDPGQTARRFVPDPFSGEEGGRLYLTGDQVRGTVEGKFSFLGRGDDQVQLRGFRIELGEIESALLAHPSVQEAVVLLWQGGEDPAGIAQLVAYTVPAPGSGPADPVDLAAFLRQRLPSYMVPVAFVEVGTLPLTANGKVDRRALPAPEGAAMATRVAVTAVDSPFTELVARIYGELLEVDDIAPSDNFFLKGGHSLLATRLMSRLRKDVGVELPLAAVFESPDVAGLAGKVEEAHRQALVPSLPPLQPRGEERSGVASLSFAQQRLWFLDQLAPGNPFYNIPLVVRLVGGLDPVRVGSSLRELTTRHDTLRTTFPSVGGRPEARIADATEVRVPLVDLSQLPSAEGEAVARRLVAAAAHRPFDLARGPLLHTLLLRLGRREHVLVLALHHIVADGWSMGVLMREMMTLYGGGSLPSLPIHYADYATWQEGWLHGEVAEVLLDEWRRRLAGSPPVLELPTDRPRPAVQSFRGGHYQHLLSADLGAGLTGVGQKRGATLFMVLLAAFQTLLARIANQEDVLVGTPIANRQQAALEGLIGLFINTLVLRAQPGAEKTFEGLLQEVKETSLSAYAHQDLPFEHLVEALQPQRDLSFTPIFQVLFVFQNLALPRFDLPDLEVEEFAAEGGTAKFDLTLTIASGDSEASGNAPLALSWVYSSDLFDHTTIRRWSRSLNRLLEKVVEVPGVVLKDLPLLSPEERHQVVREWNDRDRPVDAPPMLHRIVTRRAAERGEAMAAVEGARHLSYGELVRRAEHLAKHLRAAGVGPDVRVGISLERSLEMYWALLGVLEAGGVCVPIDPEYPAERREFLVADSGLAVLLTTHGRVDGAVGEGVPRIYLEESLQEMPSDVAGEGTGGGPTGPEPAGDSLVYVIYTSGSTGVPKGVAMTHRPLVNLVAWQSADPALQRGVRRMQFSSLSFDGSFREIFVTWGSGGTLVLVPEPLRRDVPALVRWIAQERVEKALLPAVVLRLAVREGLQRPEDLATLREVLNSGEQMVVDEGMRRLFKSLPAAGLHNHYSPSETHLVTVGPLAREPARWPELPPIGRPIQNVQIHLLDRWGKTVPMGVPGELCVGGASAARGYLGRPAQTARRFVPDPFSGIDGARMYRTGDLARTRSDGEIEFLGRIDFQIKVRGIRIEPGEIETVLAEQPGVQQVVVVAKAWPGGDARLVAYLVATAGEELVPEALRSALLERLPEPMVPSRFVVLDALPLNANRKVDRKALPEPTAADEQDGAFLAPRTEVEKQVAGVWEAILGLEAVGLRDDFFALGGHSLLATQVVSRLCTALHLEALPVRLIFEKPTVEALAAAIVGWGRGGGSEIIERQSGPGPFPLSAAQERLWFLYRMDPTSTAYNTVAAARLRGALDVDVLEGALREIVRRHGSLRTTFEEREKGVGQWVDPKVSVTLPHIDLRGLEAWRREEEVHKLCSAQGRRPFNLERGPVLRLALLDLGPEERVLLLGVHHIVSDGWSQGVFLHELEALYGAALRGLPSPLPELPVQYVDFACWQRRRLAQGALETQLNYWRERLAGPLPVLELPTDRPRPEVQSFRGISVPCRLSSEVSEGLVELSRSHGTTLYMTLLAAFSVLLYRYSWQEDLIIGCPVANRNLEETEGLIGFFVNTLVQRIDLSGSPTFATLLGRVREVTLASQIHQDVPFERLVEVVAPERDLSRNPLFQVLFQVAPASLVTAAENGVLQMESVAFEVETAKFDLAFSLVTGEEGIGGRLQYASDLFDPETMQGFLRRFDRLLRGVVENAHRPLLEYPLDEEAPKLQPVAVALPTEDDFDFD